MAIKEKNFDELKPLKPNSKKKNETNGSKEINFCDLENRNKMSKFEKVSILINKYN